MVASKQTGQDFEQLTSPYDDGHAQGTQLLTSGLLLTEGRPSAGS